MSCMAYSEITDFKYFITYLKQLGQFRDKMAIIEIKGRPKIDKGRATHHIQQVF